MKCISGSLSIICDSSGNLSVICFKVILAEKALRSGDFFSAKTRFVQCIARQASGRKQ